MIEKLFENIQEHLSMLDLAVHSSELIKIAAFNENLDGVVNETENRERIVNIIAKIQRDVEEQIHLLNPSDIDQDGILILKAWFHDLSIWSEKMLVLDKETVELLGQQKENTTKEISLIFKNKEIFKGYNQLGKKIVRVMSGINVSLTKIPYHEEIESVELMINSTFDY